MEAKFTFRNGNAHAFEVDAPGVEDRSSFMIGIKKGGSTLLAKVIRDLMPYSNKTLFEYPRQCFSEGLPHSLAVEDVDKIFQQPGYVFGVFRWLPERDLLNLGRKMNEVRDNFLLLLRDPRDVLVSLYFSDAKSHAIPKKGPLREDFERKREQLKSIEIDDYVLKKAPEYLRHFYRTLQVESLPNSVVLRYEDIIYDKPRLVRAVAEAVSADPDEEALQLIATKHDQIPEQEKEDRHIRQVHPGNYLKRLKPGTVEQLNETFSVILDKLDYDRNTIAQKG